MYKKNISLIKTKYLNKDISYFYEKIPLLKTCTDNNTGNLIFSKYFKDHLIGNNADYLMLANFLRPTFNEKVSKEILNYLNETKKVNIISIGAQADLEDMNPKEYVKTLDDTIKKIAYKMSEKSISIGVRGEFTYDVFKELGIKNVDIIGCPSYFVNGYNQKDIIKKDWNNNFKTAFYTCWEPYGPYHQNWHKKLLTEALKKTKDTKFIIQSEFSFLPYYFKNSLNMNIKEKDYKLSANKISEHFDIDISKVLSDDNIKNMIKIFINIEE